MALVIHAHQTLKLLGSVELAHIQGGGQVGLGGVNAAAVHVPGQQHHVDHMGRAEEIGGAGALVLLTGIEGGGDDCLSIDIVLAEAHAGLAALELGLGGLDVHVVVDGVEVVVVPNGADVILGNLHLIIRLTAIAHHDGGSDIFIDVLPHNGVLVLHHIEIGDVDDVVPVQGIGAVHGLGIGGPGDDVHVAGELLTLALLIAVGPDTVLAGVRLAGADAADGALVNLAHDNAHPALVTSDPLRSAGAQILVVGEQALDVVDAVLEFVLISVDLQSSPKAAHAAALGQSKNVSAVGVAQNGVLSVFGVEHIVLHGLVSSLRFVGFVVGVIGVLFLVILGVVVHLLRGSSNQSVHDLLLLLVHGVDNILDGLLVLGLLFALGLIAILRFVPVFARVGLVIRLLLGIGLVDQRGLLIGTVQGNRLVSGQDHLLLTTFPMSHVHEVNEGAGIRTGHYQADLADVAVHDVLVRRLPEPIGIDGEGHNVPVLHQLLGRFAALTLVERAVCIDAVLAVLQEGVAQDVGGFVVLVVPNKRNRLPVAVLECVVANGSPISADKIVSGSPATKVKLQIHFEHFLLRIQMVAVRPPLSGRLGYCSGARPPWGPSTASYRSSAGSRWRS